VKEGDVSELQKRARFIVLVTIPLMVLLVVPTLNDPTNIPKYSVLFFAAALGVSVLSIPKFGLFEKKNWKTWAPPILFLIVMLVMALITDQKYTAFFGNYGRNNGWFQYLGLTILFLLTAFSFNFTTLTKLFHILAVLGIIIAFYGFFQSIDRDFIDFNTLGLPVIATLGNTNFASAFMGLASIALLWELFYLKKKVVKVLIVMTLVGIAYVIYISQSAQGFFILLIGGLTFIGIKFFSSSKKISGTYFSIFGFASILGTFGLFQIGPLTKYVYQPSTTYRGDYYRAAWRMFESHPISGVGIDRFGEYYRAYRDVDAAIRLGPNSVTSYAHNAILQLLATGGIFLFLAYLVFIIFVVAAAIYGLKRFQGDDKSKFGALVSLWFAYQVQTQVSVDQITISAVGWVLSGAVVALGLNLELISAKTLQTNKSAMSRGAVANFKLVASGLTLVLIVVTFAWLSPIWRADYNIRAARILNVNSENLSLLAVKKRMLTNSTTFAPHEVRYKTLASEILANNGDLVEARRLLFLALKNDPRSFTAHDYLAQAYEFSGDFMSAIQMRNKISLLDPLNTDNWLLLGKDLASVGDYQSLNKVIELVAPLAGKSTIEDDLKALSPDVPSP
jgi:O-antigen ligase